MWRFHYLLLSFVIVGLQKIISMKKIILALLSISMIGIDGLMAQVTMPAPSPTQTLTQAFGMGKIEITYSRPVLKGREVFKEKSEIVPLDKMWRTGANAATKIRFTDNVNIGGKNIDSGTYVIYTIPHKGDWDIIINKGLTNWGIDGYKESEDVARFTAKSEKLKETVESFTIQLDEVKPESCELLLKWGNTQVEIPITTNIKDRLRSQVESALMGEKKPYWQAANFYFEWDNDMNKALSNVNKAIDENPKAFWMYLLKAKAEKALGDKTAAKTSANKVVELATTAKNDDYVKMAKDLLKTL
jgi:hypothetical protein